MLHILLVEDDPDVAEVTSSLLEYGGHHVTRAFNGCCGLKLIAQQAPEVVITDHLMPNMSGLEMIEKARGAGYCGPIILCSALLESQLPPHEARYELYLHKPYDANALLRAMANLQLRMQ